jgi:hypothetical protein
MELREVLGQRHDVVRPFPQRRQLNHDAGHALIQIESQEMCVQSGTHILLHRSDDSKIHLASRGFAEPHNLIRLEHSQQLALGFNGETRQLIEEQRPTIRGLDAAHYRFDGPRERRGGARTAGFRPCPAAAPQFTGTSGPRRLLAS